MRARYSVWALFLAFVCVEREANAQSANSDLQIRVLTTNGMPAFGALVALLDHDGRVVTEGLTSDNGFRAFTVPMGSYQVRVRRIGFSPFVSEPVLVPRKPLLLLRVTSTPVALNTMVVTGDGQCRQLTSDAGVLASLWEEIDKALEASQLTLDDLAGFGTAKVFKKEIDLQGEITLSEVKEVQIIDRRPFGIIDPVTLARKGYVRGDVYRGWEFFGPDESVLLSKEFANTHCFTAVRDAARSGQVGLAFKPVRNRKVADIQGVLWLDEASSELREMTFEYANTRLPKGINGGGETQFRRLRSGAWIVDQWRLTMPRLEMQHMHNDRFGVNSSELTQVGVTETGGSVESSRIPSQTIGAPVTGVSGIVYDSLKRKPLAGADVSLDDITVRSDREGRFRFTDVPVGTHLITFSHPALKSLGLTAMERSIEAIAPETNLYLSISSLTSSWPRICHDTASTKVGDDRRGVLHGIVSDPSGLPVDGARIRVTWRDVGVGDVRALTQPDLRLEVRTDNVGHYAACGFSSKARGVVELIVSNRSASRNSFDFDQGSVIARDLIAPAGLKQPVVVVFGTIVDKGGRPVPYAYVSEPASGRVTVSDTAGNFSLVGTPLGGIIPVSIRRVGFIAHDSTLEVKSANPIELRVTLNPRNKSDSVAADEPEIGYFEILDRVGFYQRRALMTSPKFITAADIGKLDTDRITEVLRDFDDVQVVSPLGSSGVADFPSSRDNGCALALVVNGKTTAYDSGNSIQDDTVGGSNGGQASSASDKAQVSLPRFGDAVSPADLAGIEFYPVVSGVPEQFRPNLTRCGVVVVWTRSN